MWDADRSELLSNRYVQLTREAGALSELPLALTQHAHVLFLAGELDAAALLVEEVQVATEATGSTFEPYAAMSLAALRGSEVEASALIEAIIKNVRLRGEGIGITVAEWSNAVLNNGLGRYQTALSAAERATENYDGELVFPNWGLVELIEAAARSGSPERGTAAMRGLSQCTRASGTDWALGVEARSRALLTDGESADPLYREAIERLGGTRMGAELARAHLVYGEWLRRENRRTEAREQLRSAYQMLTAMGMEGFADRARAELLATGESVRKRTVDTLTDLTAQEAQIAKLARDGRTNQEIGSQLFISPAPSSGT
jgi:ATP/maltotriose-dependent transcriptional regulator MalT